jgi:hypothetical protein
MRKENQRRRPSASQPIGGACQATACLPSAWAIIPDQHFVLAQLHRLSLYTFSAQAYNASITKVCSRIKQTRRTHKMNYERRELKYKPCGSWMPLDNDLHWRWYNPLNLLIVLPLLVLALSWLTSL